MAIFFRVVLRMHNGDPNVNARARPACVVSQENARGGIGAMAGGQHDIGSDQRARTVKLFVVAHGHAIGKVRGGHAAYNPQAGTG